MSPREKREATCSQPASSRLIFLFPLMLLWEPCQLPLWKQLLIALAQIRPSSQVPSNITLQCCSEVLGRVKKKNPNLYPSNRCMDKTDLMVCLLLGLFRDEGLRVLAMLQILHYLRCAHQGKCPQIICLCNIAFG